LQQFVVLLHLGGGAGAPAAGPARGADHRSAGVGGR
jgi:hypothetical protein